MPNNASRPTRVVNAGADATTQPIIRLVDVRKVLIPDMRLRAISAKHLLSLAESICAHGLISPPSVDLNNVVLAGAHRVAACQLIEHEDLVQRRELFLMLTDQHEIDRSQLPIQLQNNLALLDALDHASWRQQHPQGRIPVRIYSFDSIRDESRALTVEVVENEKRRNFTRDEIAPLVDRLKKAGFKATRGKPKPGERPLSAELGTILGVSRRTVVRLLGGMDNPGDERRIRSNRGRKKKPAWRKALDHLRVLNTAVEAIDAASLPTEWKTFARAVKTLSQSAETVAKVLGQKQEDARTERRRSLSRPVRKKP